MTMRRPDVVEVVVLAADAHHLLRGRGAGVVALFPPEEQVLELVHAGVREEQRRVVSRDERRAGHDAVAVLLEVLQEGRADLVRGHCLYFRTPLTRSMSLMSTVTVGGWPATDRHRGHQ